MTAVFGAPDQTWEHPAVECRDLDGKVTTVEGRDLTARWGDLTASFAGNQMLAYKWGPPRVGWPIAHFTDGKLGAPMRTVLENPERYSDHQTPYGYLWKSWTTPEVVGFASGPRLDGVVTALVIRPAFMCMGLE